MIFLGDDKMVNNSMGKIKNNNSLDLACAKISHEIKNPVAIIASTLQLIELQLPDVKNLKHWNKLYHELDFISALLNDFNELSHTQQYDLKEMDLGELISEVYERFEPYAIQNGVSMSMNLPRELFNISGDEIKLIEAFTNLLKNAVEAFKEKGHVHLAIYLIEEQVVVTIEDNGCGIESDRLSSIFHPFITFKENGTGLGLPIVASIIEGHGGVLSVESAINVGTKFTVTLPISPL